MVAVWEPLGFCAAGEQGLPAPENRLRCSLGTEISTSTHHTCTFFFRRGLHTTRKDEGLGMGGEAQEKSRDEADVPSCEGGRDRERRATAAPPGGRPCWEPWAFLSSKSCTHTNCVSNIKRTRYYDLKEPTVWNLSRFRQDKRGKGMLAETK